MMGPDDDEYKCVICNRLTYHRRFSHTHEKIIRIRKLVDELREAGYDSWLDEREYCEYCSENKDAKEDTWVKEGLAFNIRFSSEQPYHQVRTIRESEYSCLSAFLLGNDCFEGERDYTFSMYDNIDVVCKMTGLGKLVLDKWLDARISEFPNSWENIKDDTPRSLDFYRMILAQNEDDSGDNK